MENSSFTKIPLVVFAIATIAVCWLPPTGAIGFAPEKENTSGSPSNNPEELHATPSTSSSTTVATNDTLTGTDTDDPISVMSKTVECLRLFGETHGVANACHLIIANLIKYGLWRVRLPSKFIHPDMPSVECLHRGLSIENANRYLPPVREYCCIESYEGREDEASFLLEEDFLSKLYENNAALCEKSTAERRLREEEKARIIEEKKNIRRLKGDRWKQFNIERANRTAQRYEEEEDEERPRKGRAERNIEKKLAGKRFKKKKQLEEDELESSILHHDRQYATIKWNRNVSEEMRKNNFELRKNPRKVVKVKFFMYMQEFETEKVVLCVAHITSGHLILTVPKSVGEWVCDQMKSAGITEGSDDGYTEPQDEEKYRHFLFNGPNEPAEHDYLDELKTESGWNDFKQRHSPVQIGSVMLPVFQQLLTVVYGTLKHIVMRSDSDYRPIMNICVRWLVHFLKIAPGNFRASGSPIALIISGILSDVNMRYGTQQGEHLD